MTPIAKTGLCPHRPARFEATGRTFPEIEAAVRKAVDDHLIEMHPKEAFA